MSRTLRRAARSVAAVLLRVRDFIPLTSLGALVLLGASLAYFAFGVPRVDYVVQLASVLAGALVALAIVVVVIGALLTRDAARRALEGPRPPLALEACRGWAEGFELSARRWLPLLEVTWAWEAPVGYRVNVSSELGRLVERAETVRRGRASAVVRRFVVEDGFGLARLAFSIVDTREVRALPWAGSLERSRLLRALARGDDLPHPEGAPDGDRVDMRRYVPGDPLRLTLWKVYARTRQLMVRMPERAIAPAVRVAAYLPSALGDEPAAAAARVAIQGGLLGADWTFSADGALRAARDSEGALELILDSRAHRGRPTGDAAGLAGFLAEAGRSGPIRIVLFVPGWPGPWLERVVDAVRGRPGSVSAVVVTDGVRRDLERGRRLERWLKVPEPPRDEDEAVVTQDALEQVVRTLSAAGAEVTAVDRVAGAALGIGAAPARAPARGGAFAPSGRSAA